MLRAPRLILGLVVLAAAPIGAQLRSDPVPDTAVHAVSYVEVMPASRAAAAAAFARYKEASGRNGALAVDVFEQTGRPGHHAVVEAWRDQPAFDAAASTTRKPLLNALAAIRVSGYDQRPYKTLTLGPRDPSGGRAVWVVTHVDVSPSPVVPEMLTRLAEASRREAGNLRFDVVQHTMRANHFTVVEGWQTQEALDAHAAAPHTRQYRDQLQPMTGSPLDERVYTRLP